MKKIDTKHVIDFKYDELHIETEFVYYDGPKIFTAKFKESTLFLFYFLEQDAHIDRFLATEVTEDIIADFMSNKSTINDVFKDKNVLIFDFGNNCEVNKIYNLSFSEMLRLYIVPNVTLFGLPEKD